MDTPANYLPLASSDRPLRNELAHTLLSKDAEITGKEIVGPEQVVGPESKNLETLTENLEIDPNSKEFMILSVVKSNRGNLRIGNINFSKI
jgi:hypothetical protein